MTVYMTVKNVVAQFIGLPLCHCEERDSSLTLRNGLRNLGGKAMRLPRPDKSGLAMTKSGGPDKSGNYKKSGCVRR